jgi:hypothetical protein
MKRFTFCQRSLGRKEGGTLDMEQRGRNVGHGPCSMTVISAFTHSFDPYLLTPIFGKAL